MLGYSPLDTTVTLGPTRSPLVLRIKPLPFRLAAVRVAGRRKKGGCVDTGIPTAATNPQLAAIFEQLGVNIERYRILIEKYPFSYRRQENELVRVSGGSDSTISVDTAVYDSRDRRPYHVGSIVYNDSTTNGRKRTMMYLPTFADLADSAFDAAHCFEYAGTEHNEIRVDFQAADRIRVPDVDGSVFLDATRYIVRRAVFHLTKARLANASILGLTATTTFEEVLPLVPILGYTQTERPLAPTLNTSAKLQSSGNGPGSLDYRAVQTRVGIERDSVLDHTFIGDEVGAAPAPTPPPARATVIAVGCSMPPSFETVDIPIYGTVGGARRGDRNTDRLTLGLQRQFHLPDNVASPVYGFEFNSEVAPTLTGQVTFTLTRGGRLESLVLSATSLLPAVDSALVTAVRRADSLEAFVGVRAGQYTISLSSAKPDADALAVDLAHLAVPAVRLAHKARIDDKSPVPALPAGNGTFEFVVDEHGQALPSTMLTLDASSAAFVKAVNKNLDKLRFQPAIAGDCPVKQIVRQPFAAQYRVQEQ